MERVLRDIDRAYNVSVCVESALAFVAPIPRFVFLPTMRTPLRRFVRIDADDENPRQSRVLLN